MLVQNSCPSSEEAKNLGAFAWPASSTGLQAQPESRDEEAVHAQVGAPSLQYPSFSHQTHNVPCSQSRGHASQQAEDKWFLLSEK